MKPKEDLDLIAAAAAKLVLQELDPTARKKRQEFSIGLPQGMLCIHAKSLRSINKAAFFASTFSHCSEVSVFLQISVQDTSKCSKILHLHRDVTGSRGKQVLQKWKQRSSLAQSEHSSGVSHTSVSAYRDNPTAANEIIVDEMKTYSVEISPKREDPKNYIMFELVAAENDKDAVQNGSKVGYAAMHIYDLIKEMYGNKMISITIKEKNLAYLEFEYVLRYGTLGYGYSHQLKQKENSISHILSESMFFRLPAPLGRRDADGFLASSNRPKPRFIPFVKVEENQAHYTSSHIHDNASLKSQFQAEHTSNVIQLIQNRKRLGRMRKEFLGLTTRHDRTEYLQSLVAKLGVTKAKGGLYSDDEDDNDEDVDDHSPHIVRQREAETDPLKAMVDNLSPLLLMATGLSKRGSRPGVIRRRSFGNYVDIEDTNDADVEDNDITKPTPAASTTAFHLGADESITTLTDPSPILQTKGIFHSLVKKIFAPAQRFRKILRGQEESTPTLLPNERISPVPEVLAATSAALSKISSERQDLDFDSERSSKRTMNSINSKEI